LSPRYWKIAALSSVLCTACSIGPKYQVPVVAQTPVAYKEFEGNDEWKMATPSDALMKGK
jgi:hypothetical protein